MTSVARSWWPFVLVSSALLGACGDDRGASSSTTSSAATTGAPATSAASSTSAAGPTVFVRAQDSIAVPLGETFVIELDSNATTGYAWEPNDEVGSSIELVNREYIAPQTSAVGAGGVEHFTFTAAHVGTTMITFEYRRSFEPPTEPAADTATFTVTVTG